MATLLTAPHPSCLIVATSRKMQSEAVINYHECMEYLAHALGIRTITVDLHSENPHFDGYAWPARREIGLDMSIIGTRHGRCVFDEEVSHCLVTPFADHRLYHSRRYWELDAATRSDIRVKVVKDENGALRWATDAVIPDDLFFAYLGTGPYEIWEWCDHFDVEPWFMKFKIGYMVRKGKLLGGRPFKKRDAVRHGVKSIKGVG